MQRAKLTFYMQQSTDVLRPPIPILSSYLALGSSTKNKRLSHIASGTLSNLLESWRNSLKFQPSNKSFLCLFWTDWSCELAYLMIKQDQSDSMISKADEGRSWIRSRTERRKEMELSKRRNQKERKARDLPLWLCGRTAQQLRVVSHEITSSNLMSCSPKKTWGLFPFPLGRLLTLSLCQIWLLTSFGLISFHFLNEWKTDLT